MDDNLAINTELASEILTNFIRSEITRSGFKRAVLGLSGGIDSALSCCPGCTGVWDLKMCWQCACLIKHPPSSHWSMPRWLSTHWECNR